jgi:hypothetical protein
MERKIISFRIKIRYKSQVRNNIYIVKNAYHYGAKNNIIYFLIVS